MILYLLIPCLILIGLVWLMHRISKNPRSFQRDLNSTTPTDAESAVFLAMAQGHDLDAHHNHNGHGHSHSHDCGSHSHSDFGGHDSGSSGVDGGGDCGCSGHHG